MGTKLTLTAVAITAVFSFTSAHVGAQTPVTQSATDETMENIVVIGRSETTPMNMAANVTVIDSAEIQLSGATNVTNLLRNRSGIQVADNGSGATFSMRGFSASGASNNTLIMVDGRRLNNIDIAAPSIDSVPLNQVERIEILSGSAGVIYGDQAVGGVINIITKAPNGSGGGLQLSGGSFNTYEVKGDIAGEISANWRYFLAGSHLKSDNYRQNNENKTGSILGRIQYKDDAQDFFVESNYFDDYRQVPGALTQSEYQLDPRLSNNTSINDSHQMTTSVRSGYQRQLSQQWAVNVEASYTDTLSTANIFGPSTNERSQFSFLPKAIGKYVLDHGEMTLIGGVDLLIGKADFDSAYTVRNNTQTMTSAFVQATVPLTAQLSYVVGGRYSDVSDDLTDRTLYPTGVTLDNDAHAFELGLNFRPNRHQRFYIRADDNFRFAKIDEQAFTPITTFGLDPQTGRSYEAGWDWTTSAQTLSLNVYRLDLEDEIVYDGSRTDGPTGSGANINADASKRYGVSGQYKLNFAKDWLLGVEYNYIDAEFTEGENQGNALSWVAEHSGRSFLSYDLNDNWQFFAEGVYTAERYMEGDNGNVGEKLSSYLLTHLSINFQQHNWQASLRVDNLTDKKYVAAGYFSVWGSGFYAGTGREVRLTAGYRF
ncbi:TonB-dependent receptor [Shewanella intestini]|uniref:TonB-dependent receptor n=1 Tax=Shewanella intestini TaxID=2017544 RepID=A0ABS5I3C2_9GAMM|nr:MULTISPECIES: TonB-dependent receptor [Shewanella]MBR9728520.1 TonB-dependent receptor [Shewanella intestini]MRG36339.1 TonB-dependent receptor [Shewanella sp. XMDDZSB0408]